MTSIVLILFALSLATHCEAAGPWKGQIIDTETNKPLEGVVVFARWEKRYTSFVGEMGGNEYYGSEEVVTNAEGRFLIQARQTWTLNPLSEIYGPEIFIVKFGYGRWQFHDFDNWWEKNVTEGGGRERAERRRFTGEGALLELPPLKTKQERIEFSGHMPLRVPVIHMQKYLEELNRHRKSLGLQPIDPRE
jgi:hypothetical protein